MPFTFQRLTRDDLPLFHAWLQRPHVAEWWGNQGTLEELEAEYASTFAPEAPDRAYLALLDGTAVGFIQSYTVVGSPDGWWPDETDPGARGIDQFLADGARLGQGLG